MTHEFIHLGIQLILVFFLALQRSLGLTVVELYHIIAAMNSLLSWGVASRVHSVLGYILYDGVERTAVFPLPP